MLNTEHNHILLREGLPSKSEFPLLVKHPDLHYLDSAATTQKPQCVIDAITQCYESTCSPVHRGVYELASDASECYEQARQSVARLINSPSAQQCVFTRSATEAINLVAIGWAKQRLTPSDEVWVSEMEHHANYLPWQRVCKETGASLRIIKVSAEGELLINEQLLYRTNVKLIALSHVSNVLGCINPIIEIAKQAKQHGIPVLIDACQSVGHLPVDVQLIDCAFMAFSAHKMYGPEGIGVLYGKREYLEQCEPLLVGGGMVDTVATGSLRLGNENKTLWAELPAKLEAGSPYLSGAVGFSAAIEFVQSIGIENLHAHSTKLAAQAKALIKSLDGVQVIGASGSIEQGLESHVGIVSFVVDGVHPHDVAQVAADNNVAIRAGHHCAQPLMQALGLNSALRASFGVYNTASDVQALVEAVENAQRIFRRY